MSEPKSDTTKGTDCRLPDGHRYGANGRCEWCDAERAPLSDANSFRPLTHYGWGYSDER